MLQLPPQTLQAIGEASSSCEPGVSTVRIAPAGDADAASLMHCREVESEAGFVCKKCRLAFPGEAGLLAHQRVACYPGKSADSRGAVRLVQVHYECKVCTAPERATPTEKMSIQEFKRHCETEAHVSRLRASPQPPPSPLQAKHPTPSPRLPPPPPAASVSPSAGLSHEMEDVVNQITLLAARAAAESTSPGAAPTDSNANIAGSKDSRDFCHPAEPKRSKLLQLHAGEVPAPVAPTCSPVAVPSTGHVLFSTLIRAANRDSQRSAVRPSPFAARIKVENNALYFDNTILEETLITQMHSPVVWQHRKEQLMSGRVGIVKETTLCRDSSPIRQWEERIRKQRDGERGHCISQDDSDTLKKWKTVGLSLQEICALRSEPSSDVKKMGIESCSEEDGEGQEEQSLISWMIRGSLSLAMNDTFPLIFVFNPEPIR
ncbi:hypothetical protein C0J52_16605 [Blattella germanica]|nr:hypothetical protein C0J52_16605 [Blattella germanica]